MKSLLLSLALAIPAAAQATFPVTIAVSPAGGGTLAPSKSSSGVINGACTVGTTTVVSGTGIGCTVTPAAGFIFSHWQATAPIWCNGSAGLTCGPYAVISAGATLTAVLTPSGGTVTPPPTQYCPNQAGVACSVALLWAAPQTIAPGTGGGYNVYRSSGSSSSFTKIATAVAVTSYTDPTIAASTAYQYYVTYQNSAGESAPSNTFSISVPGPPPPPPVTTPPSSLNGTVQPPQ